MTQQIATDTGAVETAANKEQSVEQARNDILRQHIAEGKIPLLPFELEILRKRLSTLGAEQKTRGRLMQEARTQSSETWHDNAPADALTAQSQTATEQIIGISQTIDVSVEVEYPQDSEPAATLGSLVFVRFDGSDVVPVFISGSVRDVIDIDMLTIPDDSEIMTLQSPLGSAMLDAKEGDMVTYEVRGRSMSVEIGEILQLQP